MHALTPEFFAAHDAVPAPVFHSLVKSATRTALAFAGSRVDVEGELPRTPALLCTNATHRYDFITLMKAVDQSGARVVSVSKAKNFHSAPLAFMMKRCGVVPLASRGYFILADFMAVHGRRPTDDEYRALRAHVDDGTPLSGDELTRMTTTARRIAGRAFDPQGILGGPTTWRAAIEGAFAFSTSETVRLARAAVDVGHHVQIYPEGTVSARLGTGRRGAVQLAHALGLPIVPVGMSGCPDVFVGNTPLPKRGRVVVRVGAPLNVSLPREHRAFLPADERDHRAALDHATEQVMDALDGLLDAKYRRASSPVPAQTRTSALL